MRDRLLVALVVVGFLTGCKKLPTEPPPFVPDGPCQLQPCVALPRP